MHMPEEINDREFNMILPKFDNNGKKIDSDELEDLIKRVSNRFGGSTSITENIGCFVPEDERPDVDDEDEADMLQEELGNMQCEEVIQVAALRGSDSNVPLDEDREFFKNLAERAAEELGQFSITVNEDRTEFSFVEGDNSFEPGLDEDKLGHGDIFERLV